MRSSILISVTLVHCSYMQLQLQNTFLNYKHQLKSLIPEATISTQPQESNQMSTTVLTGGLPTVPNPDQEPPEIIPASPVQAPTQVTDRESVTQLLKLLEEFKTNCGLEINTSKTEALWLGSWRNCRETPYNFKWLKESVQALGVHFSYDEQYSNRLNFEEKIRNIEKVLNAWRRRKLTLIGRIKIVKSLGLSKIIYCTSVLPIPPLLAERINKLTFNFIWEGKTCQNKEENNNCRKETWRIENDGF